MLLTASIGSQSRREKEPFGKAIAQTFLSFIQQKLLIGFLNNFSNLRIAIFQAKPETAQLVTS
jgi:hypothetical protein